MAWKLAAIIVSGSVLACGCGAGSGFPSGVALAVENRTNSQLALTSDLLIAPCAEATFTLDQVLAASQEQRAISSLGGNGLGEGAVTLAISADVGRQAVTGGPVVAVVTSSGASFSTGSLDRSKLPACAGTATNP